MAKRKRNDNADAANVEEKSSGKKTKATETSKPAHGESAATIQIVVGSYDRVLHGITATLSGDEVQFADTFLFNAHASAIRCLAISPPSAPAPGKAQKVILATGSTDERVNLYHLSAHPPRASGEPATPSLSSRAVLENPQNKELGSLLHHSSAITALCFANRSKLLSSAEDCAIAVTRTRDWSLLSTIKAPRPKVQGRPSGDTAGPGGTPAGINDFAVHPSLKLMLSVGKGEPCMRLWNLVTGKKAGVLGFGRDTLGEVGEGRHGGEGRRVVWGSGAAGDEFSVGFERGAVVFGMDSRPRCTAVPAPPTTLQQLCYVAAAEDGEAALPALLAVSTADGRIVFYATDVDADAASADAATADTATAAAVAPARVVAQLAAPAKGRLKDFAVLGADAAGRRLVVAAGSDGRVTLWALDAAALAAAAAPRGPPLPPDAARLLATYETGHRITCLGAFVMLARAAGAEGAEAGAGRGEAVASE